MKIGLSFDLKESVPHDSDEAFDALEEYDSEETIAIIRQAFESDGHEVVLLGGGEEFLGNIRSEKNIDIVFNIAEGHGTYRSREAQVPAILEMLDIPYTGSDPMTLALCLDKPMTKKLVAVEGVLTPRWEIIHPGEEIDPNVLTRFWYPAIIKPAFEGSSKGIHTSALVMNVQEASNEITTQLSNYRQPVLIEEFIDGEEVTVGIIGNTEPEIVGIMRIRPREKTEHFVYSLEVKRDWENLVDYECPANLDSKTIKRITEYSMKVYAALGCRDFSRVDFRIDRSGNPYFIEINPLPGLGTYSDLIIMGEKTGRVHEEIIQSVLKAGIDRYPKIVRCV